LESPEAGVRGTTLEGVDGVETLSDLVHSQARRQHLSAMKSVMIPCLQEVHSVVEDPIHQPVLIREPPGPDVRPKVFEGLGLADSFKGVPEDRLE
jgi:hypothetical protein